MEPCSVPQVPPKYVPQESPATAFSQCQRKPEILHRADAFEPVNSELDKRPSATQNVNELLGVLRRAQRPETAAHATSHDDDVVVFHFILFDLILYIKFIEYYIQQTNVAFAYVCICEFNAAML